MSKKAEQVFEKIALNRKTIFKAINNRANELKELDYIAKKDAIKSLEAKMYTGSSSPYSLNASRSFEKLRDRGLKTKKQLANMSGKDQTNYITDDILRILKNVD